MEVFGQDGRTLLQMKSCQVWRAIQAVYFDEKLEMPSVRRNGIQHFPDRVLNRHGAETIEAPGIALQDNSRSNVDTPSENRSRIEPDAGSDGAQSAPAGCQGPKTWKEFAGRARGEDRYRFGDFTRHAVSRLRLRRQKRAPAREVIEQESRLQSSLSAPESSSRALEQEVTRLREELEGLNVKHEDLSSKHLALVRDSLGLKKTAFLAGLGSGCLTASLVGLAAMCLM